MKQVNRYTRAGQKGKEITCPKCLGKTRVYHFSWSAITCGTCKEMINKKEFTYA
tara:strand:+ start:256 stop:417 length:162 start_codon:yes stop_codon:yes gene_type:complete